MPLKSKIKNIFVIFIVCAIGTSCKKEIYNIDGCEFVQNGVNKYSFSCTQNIDATATFSDEDLKSIATTKVENSGTKLAQQKNQSYFYISKIDAKLSNASKYPESKINIKGKILIGDIKLSQEFHDAKNTQTVLKNSN